MLRNPYDPSNEDLNIQFTAYANHYEQIEYIIQDLIDCVDPDDEWEQKKILRKYGMDFNDLSLNDRDYIVESVLSARPDLR